MTPTRLRECLALLRWSQRGLADALGRPEGTVRQWARGAVRIPDDVAAWLEKAGRWHAKNPPPARQQPEA
jgi:transcriptional regulator with XRE-family HTH domain